MSYRFHVHVAKPAYRLVTAEGRPFPAEGCEEDWRFVRSRARADTNPDVAERVDRDGYCLFKIGLGFDEVV